MARAGGLPRKLRFLAMTGGRRQGILHRAGSAGHRPARPAARSASGGREAVRPHIAQGTAGARPAGAKRPPPAGRALAVRMAHGLFWLTRQ